MGVEKAKIIVIDTGEEIPVMFNPSSYTISTTAQTSGEGSAIQFDRINVGDFSVSLFFDTYEKQTDVRKETKKIVSLLMPTVEGQETRRPSICRFVWGSFGYKGIINKVDQNFTMFLESGLPVRANLTVVFKSVITSQEDAQFKGREACRKLWTVKSGDRLDLIAFNTLKDPAQWRKIAKANMIINPLSFPTEEDLGRVLIIPD